MRTGAARAVRPGTRQGWGARQKWLLIAAVVVAALVKARFTWVPVWYLALTILTPTAGAWAWRRAPVPAPLRIVLVGLVAVVAAALCPVPWMVAAGGTSPGTAWRLDGRVTIAGHTIDPDGDWFWLTAGRPPTVAELVWSTVTGSPSETPRTMRAGPLRQRARWSEPAAAVVGLARGGWPIGTRLEAHLSGPTVESLPEKAVVVAVNGETFADAAGWSAALGALAGNNTLTTAAGDTLAFDGAEMPYLKVDVVVVPTRTVDVVVGGWLARSPAGKWWRNLATGSSHGLMVALVAYTYASGDQLGHGLTVAGTGSVRPDGSIGRIRGLAAKARAARDAGADVLLYPRGQEDELADFAAGRMELVGVATLDDAIDALHARRVT